MGVVRALLRRPKCDDLSTGKNLPAASRTTCRGPWLNVLPQMLPREQLTMAQSIRSRCECASFDYADLATNDETSGQQYGRPTDRGQLSRTACHMSEEMFGTVVTIAGGILTADRCARYHT